MSRGLTSNQNTLLEGNPFQTERLLEIQTPSVSYYYTTGAIDVAVTTPTSGGSQTFLNSNGIEIIGDIQELYELSVNELLIIIGDVGDVIFDDIVRAGDNFDFARTNVQLYLMFRNVSTGVAYTSDIINLFQGNITRVDVNRTENNVQVNIRVANKFANFDNVNGRSSSDYPQGLITEKITWGTSNV